MCIQTAMGTRTQNYCLNRSPCSFDFSLPVSDWLIVPWRHQSSLYFTVAEGHGIKCQHLRISYPYKQPEHNLARLPLRAAPDPTAIK